MKKQNDFNFNASSKKEISEEVEIGRYILRAQTMFVLSSPMLLSIDTHGLAPAECNAVFAQKKLNLYVQMQLSKQCVSNTVSVLNQTNDVVVNLNNIVVDEKKMVPVGGSFHKDANNVLYRVCREVANILVTHTTNKIEPSLWITSDKAKSFNVPFISEAVAVRQVVQVRGNDNSLTRDNIVAKLYDMTSSDAICVAFYASTRLYSSPGLMSFSSESNSYTAFYAEKKPRSLIPLDVVRIPKVVKWSIRNATTYDNIWMHYSFSTGARGHVSNRGALSVGYYRFDMMPAEVTLFDEITDIVNICHRMDISIVRMDELNINVAKVLNYNNITVLTCRTQAVQKDDKPGIYGSSLRDVKTMVWNKYSQPVPGVKDKRIVEPDPVVFPNDKMMYFNYVYIPRNAPKEVSFIPSIRAADGVCIQTNVQALDSVPLEDLLTRFGRALNFRNQFIYTRITFVSQDPCRNYFDKTWVYPKKKEVKVMELFGASEEMAIEVADDTSIEAPIEILPVSKLKSEDIVRQFSNFLQSQDSQSIVDAMGVLRDGGELYGDILRYYQNMNLKYFQRLVKERAKELGCVLAPKVDRDGDVSDVDQDNEEIDQPEIGEELDENEVTQDFTAMFTSAEDFNVVSSSK